MAQRPLPSSSLGQAASHGHDRPSARKPKRSLACSSRAGLSAGLPHPLGLAPMHRSDLTICLITDEVSASLDEGLAFARAQNIRSVDLRVIDGRNALSL